METVSGNPPIRMYVYKFENRITFKTNTGHSLQPKTNLKRMQSKKICIGVSSKVLQKEQSAIFVIPKVYKFY